MISLIPFIRCKNEKYKPTKKYCIRLNIDSFNIQTVKCYDEIRKTFISFDKNKRVGAVKIEPIAPNNKVLPNAREFFMSVFLGDANASDYSISVSGSSLEIKYLGGSL